MVIQRGLVYHDIDDIRNVAWRTLPAQKIADMDPKKLIMKASNIGANIIRRTTSRSSLFLGDFEIVFISVKAVDRISRISHLKDMLDDPFINDKASIEKEIDDLKDSIFSEDYSENTFQNIQSYVIIYMHGKDDYPVWVGTSYPEPILNLISDKRFYELDDGSVAVVDDGIPLDIFYRSKEGRIIYSKDQDKGFLHVGE